MRFPPVGVCIYCGARPPIAKLTDEHIIPHCVDGDLILEQSSCLDCNKKTGHQVEQGLFGRHGPWLAARVFCRTGFSKVTNKAGGPRVPLFWWNGDETERDDMLPDNAPLLAHYLFLKDILVFKGGDRYSIPKEFLTEVIPLRGPINASAIAPFSPPGLNIHLIPRFIAKVGHSYAVSQLGHSTFTPLLADYICQRETKHPWGLMGEGPKFGNEQKHYIQLEIVGYQNKIYAVVSFQILSGSHFPSYRVVVGEFSKEQFEALKGKRSAQV